VPSLWWSVAQGVPSSRRGVQGVGVLPHRQQIRQGGDIQRRQRRLVGIGEEASGIGERLEDPGSQHVGKPVILIEFIELRRLATAPGDSTIRRPVVRQALVATAPTIGPLPIGSHSGAEIQRTRLSIGYLIHRAVVGCAA
jgi:hypothetical protein